MERHQAQTLPVRRVNRDWHLWPAATPVSGLVGLVSTGRLRANVRWLTVSLFRLPHPRGLRQNPGLTRRGLGIVGWRAWEAQVVIEYPREIEGAHPRHLFAVQVGCVFGCGI